MNDSLTGELTRTERNLAPTRPPSDQSDRLQNERMTSRRRPLTAIFVEMGPLATVAIVAS